MRFLFIIISIILSLILTFVLYLITKGGLLLLFGLIPLALIFWGRRRTSNENK